MTVFFIGAGPGDPELLTKKAERLIGECPVCLYAGSLVPEQVVAGAPADALVMDTAPMTLDDTHEQIKRAHAKGQDVARVHSGDPSLYGAIAEQIRRLRADGIDYEIIPGVPAYAAAAAALGQELTIPEVAQSIVLTRVSMKSTSMPAGETLENFAKTGATLAIHLGVRNLREIERQLAPYYGENCPVAVVYRVGWPDQMLIRGTLSDIREKVRVEKITRTALILVGPAMGEVSDFKDSALYDPEMPHVLRPKVKP
ncbi:precorrin-4/cobalt-precorrin-4 C11-methyltransferase [Pacificibacter maritimus]|uniref:Precorrin-4/cobalt-precorrin-4 C11-methyltransferase n=1 Tax=Pacificibacter maritimus TaxID=762213 RepID=A0A3N4U4F9_9RHOB|nr:precorrin-4 C(11)-methyltransferase [Pacificibacter maritimus]RPE63205.1 precorrin-4/cobalt-precorrin-4 C11-methyltransferase [Pacificibacter maritimus]